MRKKKSNVTRRVAETLQSNDAHSSPQQVARYSGKVRNKIHPLRKKIATKRKRIRKTASGTLIKPQDHPIISPKPENGWEGWQTFNPGVILLDNTVHFLYRAIGEDGISRFGYATSHDGLKIAERLSYPVYEHGFTLNPHFFIYSLASGGSFGGAEDPRIVQVDNEDTLYVTYTACDQGLRVALTSIKVTDFLRKIWKWKPARLISPPGEAHKNWVIFPEKIHGKYAILHSISPEISIAYVDTLDFADSDYMDSCYTGGAKKTKKNCWEEQRRGAGPPPLKTNHGWLLFYHAIDKHDPGKYKVGAMILDLNDPNKILYSSQDPVLEPQEWYENEGFKPGIVYATGAVIKDGTLLIYYGGADSYVCVAYADAEEFLSAIMRGIKPALTRKIIKKIQ